MAVLTRFTIDLVTEEELPPSRIRALAREMTDNLHVLGVEKEDQAFKNVDKFAVGHTHENHGDRCYTCLEYSNDGRHGDAVAK